MWKNSTHTGNALTERPSNFAIHRAKALIYRPAEALSIQLSVQTVQRSAEV